MLLASGAGLPSGAAAAEIEFGMPAACIPGQNCWVVNYFDHDPGSGARDFRCGAMTYDKHDGTDFMLPDMAAMRQGVPVLAAAKGRVTFTRDGVDDISFRDRPTEAIKGIACGNAVYLLHGNGWATQYCHMRKGSIKVKKDDIVEEGQPLGLVGLSGLTEFPHIHIAFKHADKMIDPFVGLRPYANCGATVKPIWKESLQNVLPYQRGIPYIAGVTDINPNADAARAGTVAQPKEIPSKAAKIYVWADIIGIEAGDRVEVRMTQPDGKVVTLGNVQPKTFARRFFEAGLGRPGAGWAPGVYKFDIVLVPRGLDAGWHNQASRTVTVR